MEMNIVFCINNQYADKAAVVMTSVLDHHRSDTVHFYILSSDLSDDNLAILRKVARQATVDRIDIPADRVRDLTVNIAYISPETYYRYFIAEVLPQADRALYLDTDLIVKGNLTGLYQTDLTGYDLAGVEDMFIRDKGYKSDIGLTSSDVYVNGGVLLMNLDQMRTDRVGQKCVEQTKALTGKILYQDQDIINLVCRGKIKAVDSIYNMTSRNMRREKSKLKQACILHYTGAKKPWQTRVIQGHVWKHYARQARTLINRKIRVGLLIDEFFGGAKTAFGGYGFLARKYIAKYIPNQDIHLDVLLGKGKRHLWATRFHEDNVDLYRLPRFGFMARWWLKRKKYDIYLSIELTTDYIPRHEPDPHKRLILWIQDPRPRSAWDDVINTMQSIKDPCFYNQQVYDTVHALNEQGRVKFISQGYSLNPLARELYRLPEATPIQYLPNPIDMDFEYQFDITQKKKQVIFLGRLEAQKRAWLFCELATRMPEYDFYVLGQFFRHKDENKHMLAPYLDRDIPNLHFAGHVDGETKQRLIRESRVLCSTAIWEGIPISWLEALSYGTVLVSDLEREDLTKRFGTFVGTIPGDGFDGVDLFIPAIREMMENDELYTQKAKSAIDYVRATHNIPRFVQDLREVIMKEMHDKF